MIALLMFQASQPLSDRTMSSWPDIIKAASTNPYALFGLAILVVGTILLIGAKDWVRAIGAVGLVAGSIIVIYIVNGLAGHQNLIPYSGKVADSTTKRPVHNAVVSLFIQSNGVTLSDHTDSDGVYRLFIDTAWLDKAGKATVHADQYSDVDKNVLLAKNAAAPDFELDLLHVPEKPPDNLRVNKTALFQAAKIRPEMLPQDVIASEQNAYVSIPVSRSSGNKVSGRDREFSPWYDLCIDRPVSACTLESPQYSLRGDRNCGQWAECKMTENSPERVCFSFRMQGHSEDPAGGQTYSEGVLSAQCKLPVNAKSPAIQKVSSQDLVPIGRIQDGELVRFSLSAPGKIVYVQYSCNGPACGWMHECSTEQVCGRVTEYSGNTATWYGWRGSGAPAVLTFAVQYQ